MWVKAADVLPIHKTASVSAHETARVLQNNAEQLSLLIEHAR